MLELFLYKKANYKIFRHLPLEKKYAVNNKQE